MEHGNVITTFLYLILSLNNFVFNCKHYIQKQGVAMGTICAPSYANIFLGFFESTHIYPYIRGKCHLYTRFIDDIFMLWRGTENELLEFVNNLNKTHPTIKFELKYSRTEINFLDIVIYKDKNGKLQTKIYNKPTDHPSYLHSRSEHPIATKKSIIYSQALRIRRICSEEGEFMKACNNLISKLKMRGYKEETIRENIKRAGEMDRLLDSNKNIQSIPIIPFITTYNRTLPPIKDILQENWNILSINNTIKDKFTEKPIVAYRRNRNIKDTICSYHIVNDKVERKQRKFGSCSPCLSRKNNLCCKQVKRTKTFRSNVTKRYYKIRQTVNCKSNWVIYLLTCKKCYIQYTGKSEWPMNTRVNKHRFDANARTISIPVSEHFKTPGHSFEDDAEFIIIEKLENFEETTEKLKEKLKQRENFWIKELKTLKPHGLNMELNNV